MAFDIPASEPSPEEIARECGEASENAVEWIRSMSGIELDFTPLSLLLLDRVLSELMENLNEDIEEPTTVLLGSYLGEVILRACGGRWETGDVFTGPELHGLYGREITVSPFSRIKQAFTDLEPNHLARYWNNVVDRILKSQLLPDHAGFKTPPSTPLKKLPLTIEAAKKAANISDEELAKTIDKETRQFIDILHSDLGVELDFSINSLKFLDHYLRSLSDKIGENGDLGDQRIFVYLAGNYLGEVIRHSIGGKWIYVPEQQTSGLLIKDNDPDGTIYPHKAAANLTLEYKPGGVIAYVENIRRKMPVR